MLRYILDISKLIRTDHINKEEKQHILNLCHKDYAIFYERNYTQNRNNRRKSGLYEISMYLFIHKPEVEWQVSFRLKESFILANHHGPVIYLDRA